MLCTVDLRMNQTFEFQSNDKIIEFPTLCEILVHKKCFLKMKIFIFIFPQRKEFGNHHYDSNSQLVPLIVMKVINHWMDAAKVVVEVAAETAVEEAEVMVAAKSEVIMVATKASFFFFYSKKQASLSLFWVFSPLFYFKTGP